MSQLPRVRRADCGHGFLALDVRPAALHQNGNHEQELYLCEDCRARLQAPKVERKDVHPAGAPEVAPTPRGRRVPPPQEKP